MDGGKTNEAFTSTGQSLPPPTYHHLPDYNNEHDAAPNGSSHGGVNPSGGPTVVTIHQPQVSSEHVEDNFIVSLLSIFCCTLLGVFATLKSTESREAKHRGDIFTAKRRAMTAKKFAISAIVVGLILLIAFVVLSVALPFYYAEWQRNHRYDHYPYNGMY